MQSKCGRSLFFVGLLAVELTATGAEFRRGMVATAHPLATRAGLEALQAGGNAIDAAIACALTLGVVDGENSGIGGGCFFVLRLADGRSIAIDGRETAPRRATRDMFVQNGEPVPALSLHGALAVGVPGELAALAYASTNYGRLPLTRLLENAARVAENGFTVTRSYAGRLAEAEREIAQLPTQPFEAFQAIFRRPDGEPRRMGEVLRQPDLAATYRDIARLGVGSFYQGSFATKTATWMQEHGGLLDAADLANYRPQLRTPIRSTYRDCEIIGFPPPSSGGVHVAQILNLLEPFDLHRMGRGSADFVHVVAEAMKLAFADRAHWLGDPDFVRVPRGLTSVTYAQRLARRIRLDRVTPVTRHGEPPQAQADVFGEPRPGSTVSKHTTHFSAADADGNWVACTATVNTTFGSKVVVPGTGVVLNNEMDDFSAQPGKPNVFGLVGAEANAVAPGKRPLSSMSPTIVLRGGQPILSVGAAGGPTIITQTVLAIIEAVDFGSTPTTALAQPRFHHQWKPDELVIERGAGEDLINELARRGHHIRRVQELGATQAVGWNPTQQQFNGAHDPRLEGAAEGW